MTSFLEKRKSMFFFPRRAVKTYGGRNNIFTFGQEKKIRWQSILNFRLIKLQPLFCNATEGGRAM